MDCVGCSSMAVMERPDLTVRQWGAKLLSAMGGALSKRRQGAGRRSGKSWDHEAHLKIEGRGSYLHRAIDRDPLNAGPRRPAQGECVKPECDRHHADRMISSSNEYAALQPARDLTEPERPRLPSMSWQRSDYRSLCERRY